MSMSKKHYKELENIFKEYDLNKVMLNDICSFLKRDNPNFDKQRFLDACGIQDSD